jgi:hypothetical protein
MRWYSGRLAGSVAPAPPAPAPPAPPATPASSLYRASAARAPCMSPSCLHFNASRFSRSISACSGSAPAPAAPAVAAAPAGCCTRPRPAPAPAPPALLPLPPGFGCPVGECAPPPPPPPPPGAAIARAFVSAAAAAAASFFANSGFVVRTSNAFAFHLAASRNRSGSTYVDGAVEWGACVVQSV